LPGPCLLTQFGAFEALDQAVRSGKLQILFTHNTVDEIAAVPGYRPVL
jgi:hypothetical protein